MDCKLSAALAKRRELCYNHRLYEYGLPVMFDLKGGSIYEKQLESQILY